MESEGSSSGGGDLGIWVSGDVEIWETENLEFTKSPKYHSQNENPSCPHNGRVLISRPKKLLTLVGAFFDNFFMGQKHTKAVDF